MAMPQGALRYDPVLKVRKQAAGAIKNIDVSETRAMRFVLGTGRADGKSNDNAAANVLDPEKEHSWRENRGSTKAEVPFHAPL